VLARFAPEGVAIEATQIETPLNEERGHAVGPVIVRAYLSADSALADTRTRLEEALWHLSQILPLPSPQYQLMTQTNWSESWKANFRPLRVGRRLMIIPAWLNPPLAPENIPIRLDPGMAFGTGTHPTTQLCLATMERHLPPGAPMIDLGTGSGILSIAAAKLGAGPVLALDTDPEAVRVARANLTANDVAEQVRVEQGSVAEVLSGQFGMREAPFVVANILARVIVELLDQGLEKVVAPGGWLIVSGILDSQAYQVNAGLKAHGFTLIAQEQIEDWVAILVRR
jgi:ribosomal protein L11 methyltransferase